MNKAKRWNAPKGTTIQEANDGEFVLAGDFEGEIAKRDARIEAQEAQIKILQSDANSWQSGYDEGRRMGAKHAAPAPGGE